MALKAIAIALAAACAVPAPAQGPIDVAAITRQARADFLAQQRDQFAARTVNDSLDGRPFAIVIIPGDGNKRGGGTSDALYSFQAGSLLVSLSSSPIRENATDGPALYTEVLQFDARRTSQGRTAGTNGFGARTSFEQLAVETDGLGLVGISRTQNFDVRRLMDGPAARRIALGSRFVVRGRIAKLHDGHIAACATNFVGATVAQPTQATFLNCWVGATIDRVELIGPDGPLNQWGPPPAIVYRSGSFVDPIHFSGIVSPSDYPAGETATGTVVAAVQIGSDGHVSGCSIEQSSGSHRLDDLTCALISRRGRFPHTAAQVAVPVTWTPDPSR